MLLQQCHSNSAGSLVIARGTEWGPHYPISTLPEHLHSTILRMPKLPENIHKPKEKRFLPSLTLVTLLAHYPLPLLTPSLGVSPSPTLSSHSMFWRLLDRSLLCVFACRYGSKATGVSLELFLSRCSVITYCHYNIQNVVLFYVF